LAYGFKFIHQILRSIKLKKCSFDFVEVMACPGGCTNGGGQIAPSAGEAPETLLERVNKEYYNESPSTIEPRGQEAKRIIEDWLQTNPEKISDQLHTSYQKATLEVEKKKGCKCQSQIQW